MAMAENQLQVVDQQQNYIAKVQVTPQQALEAYRSLKEITKEVLVKDVDYGTVPGTPKPSLLKSGAENLLRFYGLGHRIHSIEQVKDWDNGFFYFSYKVTVHRILEGGQEAILSECEGSANTKEKRYRNQDAYMLVNTIQKMAIKRALVGATLQATGASGLFTQDTEDMDLGRQQNNNRGNYQNNNQRNQQNNRNSRPMNGESTEAQRKAIFSNGKRKGLSEDEVKALAMQLHRVDSITKLTKQQASDMITLFNETDGDDLKGMLGNNKSSSNAEATDDPFAGGGEEVNEDDLPF
ncbi:hypothetical protein [Alteribacter populi]|uniref:hypothetical protein n=1 Tax=Alteribacter populi TaxID=2011011 RepID=UPI000BBB6352|nr:hypothetical protein [Alteribacter populi]